MAEFTADITLSPWLREQAAKHLEQTYHMNFGGQERIRANFFRVPVEECIDRSAPAGVLRELAGQFRGRGGVRVRLSGLGRVERARVSALLEQTANRPGREGHDELALALAALWRGFDAAAKVPFDEYERAELVQYSERRPQQAAARTGMVEA
jgi:hypothetical protein